MIVLVPGNVERMNGLGVDASTAQLFRQEVQQLRWIVFCFAQDFLCAGIDCPQHEFFQAIAMKVQCPSDLPCLVFPDSTIVILKS